MVNGCEQHKQVVLAIHYIHTFTYKPGFTFEANQRSADEVLVTLRGTVPNSNYNHYVPTGPATTEIGYNAVLAIPTYLGEINLKGYIDNWLLTMVRRFEQHETFEWLKHDGQHVRPPHGPGIDPDPEPLH